MASPSAKTADISDLTTRIHHRGTITLSPDFPTSTTRPSRNPLADILAYFDGQEWRDQALCVGVDPNLFFPARGIPGEKIRDVCFSCPVRIECLDDSVKAMPKFGWQGGHPQEGRVRIRSLMEEDNLDLETADALVLADALSKVRQRRKDEKDRRFDLTTGEPILGEHVLAS